MFPNVPCYSRPTDLVICPTPLVVTESFICSNGNDDFNFIGVVTCALTFSNKNEDK